MSDPTHPADVPHTVGLRELADDYHRHVLPLVEHRHQIVALADGQRAAHAVAALVYGHAMSERALHSRWSIAADALVAGAALGQVGAAMGGLEPDEVRAGLRRWVSTQHEAGLMSDDRRDQVRVLVADAETEAGQ